MAPAARRRSARRRASAPARHDPPPPGERGDGAAGATAHVGPGAGGAIEDTLAPRSGAAEPHVDRQPAGAAAVVAQDGLAAAVEDRAEELGGGHAPPVSARAR